MGYAVFSLLYQQTGQQRCQETQEQLVRSLLSPLNGEPDPAAVPSNSLVPGVPPSGLGGRAPLGRGQGRGAPPSLSAIITTPLPEDERGRTAWGVNL